MRSRNSVRLVVVACLATILIILAASSAFADSVSIDNPDGTTLVRETQEILFGSVTYTCNDSDQVGHMQVSVSQGSNVQAIAFGTTAVTCDGMSRTTPITATQVGSKKFHPGMAVADISIYQCSGCAELASTPEVAIRLTR